MTDTTQNQTPDAFEKFMAALAMVLSSPVVVKLATAVGESLVVHAEASIVEARAQAKVTEVRCEIELMRAKAEVAQMTVLQPLELETAQAKAKAARSEALLAEAEAEAELCAFRMNAGKKPAQAA